MIWSTNINFVLINTIYLSKLSVTCKLCISNSSLSPKVTKLGVSRRQYSTLSRGSIYEINNQKLIKFDSLESGCEQIKFKYIGVSGVYRLTNKNDYSRFYIGSSNNLARRMEEYNKLTKGLRNPQSSAELEISKTPASEWCLEFIYITTPQLSLVYEQYAIINLNPSMNSYFKVVPRVNPQWGNNLDNAIIEIKKLLSLFPEGSEGYNRFFVFLKAYILANNLVYTVEEPDSKYYCSLVFVYNKNSPDKEPVVYSSINKAMKGLQISYSTLLNYISNKYVYKSNLIFSLEPLVANNFSEYKEKPEGDNQLRKHIIVFNKDNEIVFEFKSGREMARFFKIDGKVARAAIAKGEYQDFLLISREVSYRKTVYVFDSNTLELIINFDSVNKAMKYARVSFYTLKNLIDSGNPYEGKIYSYSDKL